MPAGKQDCMCMCAVVRMCAGSWTDGGARMHEECRPRTPCHAAAPRGEPGALCAGVVRPSSGVCPWE
eukprot:1729116-Alexandrium_andersonii.AAC.1